MLTHVQTEHQKYLLHATLKSVISQKKIVDTNDNQITIDILQPSHSFLLEENSLMNLERKILIGLRNLGNFYKHYQILV